MKVQQPGECREASRDNILGTTSLSSVYKSNIVENIQEQYLHQYYKAGCLLGEPNGWQLYIC